MQSSQKGRYRYRRITCILRKRGRNINYKTVSKLMKKLNLRGIRGKNRKKYNSYKGKVGKVAPNIINRDFKANKPGQKYYIDVTEFKINEEKIYLSPIIDGYNDEIISYQISYRGDLKLVMDMLDKLHLVLSENSDNKIILHSDQGFQYQNAKYIEFLKNHRLC